MAGFPIKIRMEFERPADVSQRAWAEITRQAHGEMGEQWHREFLPLHFQAGARERYGYQSRSRGYLEKKRRLFLRGLSKGTELQDLVFTGEMRSLLTSYSLIRAYPSRASVEMVAPRYITFRPFDGPAEVRKASSQPNKMAEVTTVNAAEASILSETLGNRVTSLLDAYREPKTEEI
jgi:hypothetical protein